MNNEAIRLTDNHVVLKHAVVGVQVEPWQEMNFALFGLIAGTEEFDEVKVLLGGGNSVKYNVPKGEGANEKTRIESELGWNII